MSQIQLARFHPNMLRYLLINIVSKSFFKKAFAKNLSNSNLKHLYKTYDKAITHWILLE